MRSAARTRVQTPPNKKKPSSMLKHAFGSTARRWRAAHQSELRVKEGLFFVWLCSHILVKSKTRQLKLILMPVARCLSPENRN